MNDKRRLLIVDDEPQSKRVLRRLPTTVNDRHGPTRSFYKTFTNLLSQIRTLLRKRRRSWLDSSEWLVSVAYPLSFRHRPPVLWPQRVGPLPAMQPTRPSARVPSSSRPV
jgi:hypothetical protein